MFDEILCAANHAGTGDQNGWFLPSARPVRRLGLALEPWPGFDEWVATEKLDAVFLHRPWRLTELHMHALQAAEGGVLAYHLAFDERLTTGFNSTLAAACGWGAPEVFGHKEGRPLGMICALSVAQPFDAVAEQLRAEFGGLEQVVTPMDNITKVTRVAVVGAMTDALVREAHAYGVGVYVTGQWRHPARAAVRETGVGVVALGHRRSEVWGLRALARLLGERAESQGLEVVVAPMT